MLSRNRVIYGFQSMLFGRGKVVTGKQLSTWRKGNIWEKKGKGENTQEAVVFSLNHNIALWVLDR